jgi:hypothetical protein
LDFQFNWLLSKFKIYFFQVCHNDPAERNRFIRCVYNLLQSQSAAVRYEAAGTLVTLSSAAAAVKAAAKTYIELIVKESDNNVKVLDFKDGNLGITQISFFFS